MHTRYILLTVLLLCCACMGQITLAQEKIAVPLSASRIELNNKEVKLDQVRFIFTHDGTTTICRIGEDGMLLPPPVLTRDSPRPVEVIVDFGPYAFKSYQDVNYFSKQYLGPFRLLTKRKLVQKNIQDEEKNSPSLDHIDPRKYIAIAHFGFDSWYVMSYIDRKRRRSCLKRNIFYPLFRNRNLKFNEE